VHSVLLVVVKRRTWMPFGWVVTARANSDAFRLNMAATTAWPSCQSINQHNRRL